MRGNGIVSRTWGRPQIQATLRSTPEPEARMREGAIPAQIQVPPERLEGQLVRLDCPLERGEIILALPAADHLSITLRRQDIDAEREPVVRRIALHVEGFHLRPDSGGS